jgi:hypothetical protein
VCANTILCPTMNAPNCSTTMLHLYTHLLGLESYLWGHVPIGTGNGGRVGDAFGVWVKVLSQAQICHLDITCSCHQEVETLNVIMSYPNIVEVSNSTCCLLCEPPSMH